MEWPKVQVSSNKAHTEYKFLNGGWLPVLLSYLILVAIFLPYLIVLGRDTLNPVLPFVSQAAGSPPQSGVFCTFLFLSSLIAFIGLHLLHMGLSVYKARIEDRGLRKTVTLLNRILLIPGHVGILGIVIVASYPMDFHRHNEDWMNVTIIPHLIGALSLFVGGTVFCVMFTYIMSLINPKDTKLLQTRVFLIALILSAAAIQGYTVSEAFMVEYNSVHRLASCNLERIEYNGRYIVSSICEWVLLISFTAFFATIRKEAGNFVFTMDIEVRTEETETQDEKKDRITIMKDQNCNESVAQEDNKVGKEKS